MRTLRDDLAQKFPDGTFFFAPANITNQILDFGLPAPIDLQVTGRGKDNYTRDEAWRRRLRRFREQWMYIASAGEYPTLQVDVDRR